MATVAEDLRRPAGNAGLRAMVDGYFKSPVDAAITLVCVAGILWVAKAAFIWLFIDALWSGTPQECKVNQGACWPFLTEKFRFAIFGFYPFAEQWRPLLALLLLLGMIVVTMLPRFWRPGLLLVWLAALIVMFVLMSGGVLGLESVPTSAWGGLPLTLMLALVGFVAAFPLGVALALGRRSRLPAIRTLSIAYIELIRGVPLISLLFMASVMLPLFLPEGMTIDKLLRAQVAIILFAAAYIAEVVRGGLQAVDSGQQEAASALGLGYWRMMGLVVLPQALKVSIPPMVTTFIGFFQDTTLVTIVGLFDFLSSIRASLRDPNWQGIAVPEAYLFAAVIFFAGSWSMARYSRWLEKKFNRGHR